MHKIHPPSHFIAYAVLGELNVFVGKSFSNVAWIETKEILIYRVVFGRLNGIIFNYIVKKMSEKLGMGD